MPAPRPPSGQKITTIANGLKSGLATTWVLGKIVFPITVVLVILQHTPILPAIINMVAPLMEVFGLRGDAAIPLVLGNALNLYAAIAAILSLELTVKEVYPRGHALVFPQYVY